MWARDEETRDKPRKEYDSETTVETVPSPEEVDGGDDERDGDGLDYSAAAPPESFLDTLVKL